MHNELIKKADAIVTAIHLVKYSLSAGDLVSADNRLMYAHRKLEELRRDVYFSTRNSGEVK